jgi:steroid 5-alpha reductase family enzyme
MLETLIFALGLNIVMFLVAFSLKTDKLTDISYAVTFAGIVIFGVLQNKMSVVQWIAFGIVLLWSIRLGSYLLYRIHKIGHDKRFDEMRQSFWKFGRFWVLQGLTAWVVLLPVSFLLQSNSVTEITSVVVVGVVISMFGIIFEGISDVQKFNFIQDKGNKGKWIDIGLWKYSRHPNYFGEILTWVGAYVISYTWLVGAEVYLGLIGPLFISFMLIFVSGIPILEKGADKRWSGDKNYQAYKSRTSILIPFIGKG